MHSPATLLIDQGDLPSLALLGLHVESARPVLFSMEGADRSEPARRAMIDRHAAFLSGAPIHIGSPPTLVERGDPLSPGLREAHVLMQAVLVATQLGCLRVISPFTAGRDHQAVAAAFERAGGIQQLVERDGERRAPLLEMPLVDLTDTQILELADDLRLPLAHFWPCETARTSPCGVCRGCMRWRTAFRQVGLAWPWGASGAAESVPDKGVATSA